MRARGAEGRSIGAMKSARGFASGDGVIGQVGGLDLTPAGETGIGNRHLCVRQKADSPCDRREAV
jgi:hypothetical protein